MTIVRIFSNELRGLGARISNYFPGFEDNLRREMQRPFIYGTTGYDTGVGRAARKFQGFLKGRSYTPEIYDPGPRVNEAIRNGYQMMDMYYGNDSFFYLNRQPCIAKYLDYALQLKSTYDSSLSGRAALLRDVADGREGWDAKSERQYFCVHHDPKGRYSSTQGEETYTHTKAMSWVVRRMVEFYSGKLIFEGKDCAYSGIFEDPGYAADSNIEARDIFQYLPLGAASGEMGTGEVSFHLDGVEKIPTKDLFLSMWKHGGAKEMGNHSKAVVAVPDGTSLRLDLWDRFKSDPVDNPKLVEKFVKGFSVRSAHSEMLNRSVRNGPFQDLAERNQGRRDAISLTPAEAEELRSTMSRAPRRRGIALDPEEAARIARDLGE